MKELLIIGSGGHARPVIEIAQLNNYSIVGIIDLNYQGRQEEILGIPVIGGRDKVSIFDKDSTQIALAIGDNSQRLQVMSELEGLGYTDFPVLIHPTAIVAKSALVDRGTVVCAGAIINPLVQIAIGGIINTGAILDHECKVADFVHLGPGTRLAGRVKIGTKTFIGIGSCIIQNIDVGKNTVIGAGSTVIKHIPSHSKVVGVSKFID